MKNNRSALIVMALMFNIILHVCQNLAFAADRSKILNKKCLSMLMSEEPWAEDFYNHPEVKRSYITSENTSSFKYNRISYGPGGEFGLVDLSTFAFSRTQFFVRIGPDGRILHLETVGDMSGGFSAEDFRRAFNEAMVRAQELVEKEIKTVVTDKEAFEHQDLSLNPHTRAFALSANGEYLAIAHQEYISVRNLVTGKVSAMYWFGFNRSEIDRIWLDQISNDGRFISFGSIKKGTDYTFDIQVVDAMTGAKLLHKIYEDIYHYPRINLFDGGYSELYRDRVEVYKEGKLIETFNFKQKITPDTLGLIHLNRPHAAHYNPTQNSATIFFHGRQPLLLKPGQQQDFIDSREEGVQKKSDASTNDLLSVLALHTYGFEFAASGNGKYFAQANSKGSGYNQTFRSFVDIFGSNGNLIATLSPLKKILSLGFSFDGQFLAIAGHTKSWESTMSPINKIWIYNTSNMMVPIISIEGVDLLTIDNMTFSPDNRTLYVGSVNSKRVISFSIAP